MLFISYISSLALFYTTFVFSPTKFLKVRLFYWNTQPHTHHIEMCVLVFRYKVWDNVANKFSSRVTGMKGSSQTVSRWNTIFFSEMRTRTELSIHFLYVSLFIKGLPFLFVNSPLWITLKLLLSFSSISGTPSCVRWPVPLFFCRLKPF